MLKNLFLIMAFCVGLIGFSQEAPKPVTGTFAKKYPNATVINWEELENSTWRVHYIIKKENYTSIFAVVGDWIQTQYEISIDDIPEKVSATLKQNYPDYDVSMVEMIITPDLTKYLLTIGDGKQDQEIIINENGEIIK